MEQLPEHLVLEILSRLPDSTELARCRLVCRTFNAVSYDVKSLRLFCSYSRFLKSRSPSAKFQTTPFKTIVKEWIANSRRIETVSIGFEEPLDQPFDDVDDDTADDLYLTEVNFVQEWLPRVCTDLSVLSITDFWLQSCWRRSDILALISSCCHSLLKLELKNTWLSVDGLTALLNLTSLSLEFIRLDDENLEKINTCFPFLQVLNLLGVGGLKDPKIHLLHLKTCQWTVSNYPDSLSICAPSLKKLRLKCVKPTSLVLETPLLSDFSLYIVQADSYQVKDLTSLRILQLSAPDLNNPLAFFSSAGAIEKLTVNSMGCNVSCPACNGNDNEIPKSGLGILLDCFPNVTSLTVGSGAWVLFEFWFRAVGWEGRTDINHLKEVTVCLGEFDADETVSFISSFLDKCPNLSDMTVLMHQDTDSGLFGKLMSRLNAEWRKVRWKCGVWIEAENVILDPLSWKIVGRVQGFN